MKDQMVQNQSLILLLNKKLLTKLNKRLILFLYTFYYYYIMLSLSKVANSTDLKVYFATESHKLDFIKDYYNSFNKKEADIISRELYLWSMFEGELATVDGNGDENGIVTTWINNRYEPGQETICFVTDDEPLPIFSDGGDLISGAKYYYEADIKDFIYKLLTDNEVIFKYKMDY